MKAYTDLSQSKTLSKILPIESADMGYLWTGTSYCDYPVSNQTIFKRVENMPCWSLAALLDILHDYTLQTNSDGSVFVVCDSRKPMVSDSYKNPIDACYTMIVELKERNLI